MANHTDQEYEDFMYFSPDEEITNHSQKVIKTRKPHDCITQFGVHEIVAGSRAVRESAIQEGVGRVSNYICLDHADRYLEMEVKNANS